MRNLRNPKWLFFINTIPILVLFFLLYEQYKIINTLLNEESIHLWKTFGVALGALGLLNFLYTGYLTVKKKDIPTWFSFISLFCYIAYIYVYANYHSRIFPFSIPRWMMSGYVSLYVGTFLMPTLAYSLFTLVIHFTPKNKKHNALTNFFIAIIIPISGYVFTQTILPLWQPSFDSEFVYHVAIILIITTTLVFLFFLIRTVFILAMNKSALLKKYQLAWKIPITLILPLVGLALNNGIIFKKIIGNDTGIFGDFSNYWFYILALLNGLLLCLPNLNNQHYRLFIFLGRCVTFAFTLYFFMVFLPFLPLSVIAMIIVGTGFLMLSPLLLFVIHVNELSKDFMYLKTQFSNKIIISVAILSFLIIPLFITLSNIYHKRVLNETLAYIYSPDYSKTYDINRASLQKTMDAIKMQKDYGSPFLENQTPYISTYFNYIVLDNLTLSDAKINTIEEIFFDNKPLNDPIRRIPDENVNISNITTNSTYDKTQNVWKSWVNLELTNYSSDTWFAEYATTIELPEACWISDYYLYIGDRKEHGILAEKKSVMWVFSQIKNSQQDPGILYYTTGNKVRFSVFPFDENQVRKTGIEFLHKEPIRLNIDQNIIELGNAPDSNYETVETEHVIYVSSKEKETLTSIKRQPYFHFLIDASKNQQDKINQFSNRIETLIKKYPSLSENAKISFVNSYENTVIYNSDWKETYEKQTFEGGFNLDRTIRKVLINAYKSKSEIYPVLVVLTKDLNHAVIHRDFSDLAFTFPESDIFFSLDNKGSLVEHSLTHFPKKEGTKTDRTCMFCDTVLEYKLPDQSSAYLSDNNEPSIILKNDLFKIDAAAVKEKQWESALNLQGLWRSQSIHPEVSDKEWINLLKYSFISKVMTPVTSYIVVENKAQKAILKKKQNEVIAGNKSLDLSEDTQRMSEPSLVILALLLSIIIWLREKRKKRIKNI